VPDTPKVASEPVTPEKTADKGIPAPEIKKVETVQTPLFDKIKDWQKANPKASINLWKVKNPDLVETLKTEVAKAGMKEREYWSAAAEELRLEGDSKTAA
jgi:hypothetical protein